MMVSDTQRYQAQTVLHGEHWLEQAWLMASLTPVQSLNLQHQLDTLAVGKSTSMVAVHSDFSIAKTWVNGRLVFDRDAVSSQEALCI
nr:amidohydrolase family protein [uncultured Vibrio sp.]